MSPPLHFDGILQRLLAILSTPNELHGVVKGSKVQSRAVRVHVV
jgi:hypothetical protein